MLKHIEKLYKETQIFITVSESYKCHPSESGVGCRESGVEGFLGSRELGVVKKKLGVVSQKKVFGSRESDEN